MISYVTIAYYIYYHTIIKEIIVYVRKPSPRTKYCCQSPQHLFIQTPLLSAAASRVYLQLTLKPIKIQAPSHHFYDCIPRLPVTIR